MESWPIPHRARLRPAAPRARDRGLAAHRRQGAAEGNGGSRDDPGRPGPAQRPLRCDWPTLSIPSGAQSHDQVGRARGSAQMTSLTVTINGRIYGPRDVRDDLTMNDFLREYLGMTGTKFGCGAAQCLSCAIIIDDPDGTSHTSPTCIVPAGS